MEPEFLHQESNKNIDYYQHLSQLNIQQTEQQQQIIFSNIQNALGQQQFQLTLNQKPTENVIIYQSIAQFLRQQNECNYSILNSCQEQIFQEVLQWNKLQKLAANGDPFENQHTYLDQIERWFQAQYKLILKNLQQIYSITEKLKVLPFVNDDAQNWLALLACNYETISTALVKTAILIEEQPVQVLNKDKKFQTKCRFLLGSAGANLEVSVNMLSQNELKTLLLEGFTIESIKNLNSKITFEPGTSNKKLEYYTQTGQTMASFKLKLKKFERSQRNTNETVMDEKYYLVYYASISKATERILIWNYSLPMVIVAHGTIQAPIAWGVITWDNAFRTLEENNFSVPDQVFWKDLKPILSRKFASFTATGKQLDEEHLGFLGNKLCRLDLRKWPSDQEIVTWNKMCKENLSGCSHTFWQWFYAAMKLTRDHLKEFWQCGLIRGFMFRSEAEELLRDSKVDEGSFLLRFSDSSLGYLASVVCSATDVQSAQIFCGKPHECFVDNILTCESLKKLYGTSSPKETYFNKTHPTPKNTHGYVTIETKKYLSPPNVSPPRSDHCFLSSPNPLRTSLHGDVSPNTDTNFDMSTLLHLSSNFINDAALTNNEISINIEHGIHNIPQPRNLDIMQNNSENVNSVNSRELLVDKSKLHDIQKQIHGNLTTDYNPVNFDFAIPNDIGANQNPTVLSSVEFSEKLINNNSNIDDLLMELDCLSDSIEFSNVNFERSSIEASVIPKH